MHTSQFDSCTINHNGDYSGEIYISNKYNEERVNEIIEIKTTTKALITLYTSRKKKSKILEIPGKDIYEMGYLSIKVLTKDIEEFIKIIILDKVEWKLGETNVKFDKILQIANILKIKI